VSNAQFWLAGSSSFIATTIAILLVAAQSVG
jgi:hypothetical protein